MSTKPQSQSQCYTCPCCGYPRLDVRPYQEMSNDDIPVPESVQPPYRLHFGGASYDVCSCCSFEFGLEDDPPDMAPITFEQYLREWISDGANWFSPQDQPQDWDLARQLRAAGIQYEWLPEAICALAQEDSPLPCFPHEAESNQEMIDHRLLGTWQSDTCKTIQEIRNRRDVPESKLKELRSIFGELRIRYTRNRMYSEFEGNRSVHPYQVVAKDLDSVSIMAPGDVCDDQVYHVHFDRDHYWICLGRFREYFKKVAE